MYAKFFGLKQEPFSIAPDPRYLFMSERHREALAHLLYGVNGGGGFVLLSGEIGAGKTTVCRCFLEQVPRRCNVAYIFNPKLTVEELLRSICEEFRIPYEHDGPGVPTAKDYVDALNQYLLTTHAVGQNNVLIIDEAQNLSADVLEQLRLLTNLETAERKLLQIILIGQPELREMLAKPQLEQLAQRVIARFHLDALSEAETVKYIRHRLTVAGLSRAFPFDRKALQRIHRLSRGVPRRINLLCDRALLGAYAGSRPRVELDIVDKAAGEVFGPADAAAGRLSWRRIATVGSGVIAGAALFGVVSWATDSGPRRAAPVVVARAPAASAAASGSAAASAAAPAPVAAVAAASTAAAASAPSWIRSERDAWRELAQAWQLELPDGDPCQAAQQQRLQCFKTPATTLALIRALGRPGFVTVHDAQGKPAYALLTGLTAQQATLRSGGVTHTVSLATLADSWRGDFATFWRAPPGYGRRPGDGESGPAVDWLALKLASLRGEAPATRPAMDAQMKSRIQAFQLSQGLEADGLAGPMTFMQLNRASGVDEPRLQTER
ncbi:MAG TPA: AAA family ATPase [Albitalea sp.]|nr:AAA family ATPase [Albitalea sp.]